MPAATSRSTPSSRPVRPARHRAPRLPLIDDTRYPNIGDRLTGAGICWNWYSGGWDDAEAGHPGPLFQYHHQPFNYFADYAPGQPGREHLKDETKFIAAAKAAPCRPSRSSSRTAPRTSTPATPASPTAATTSSTCSRRSANGPQADKTLVVVTYDEFGGQWDHVAAADVDAWGPGTRSPRWCSPPR